MKVTVISVGKLKERYLKEGISEYIKRLTSFCDIDIVEVEDEQTPENLSLAQEKQVKKREAERILKKINRGSAVIALDLKGERLSSESFASKLRSFFISGVSHITFVIGGSLGLDDSIINTARLRLSISRLTFPHQLARLILVEQLSRAFDILKNEVSNSSTYL